MNISWEDFLLKKKNSITFTEEPMYTFGVVFNKVSVKVKHMIHIYIYHYSIEAK